LRLAAAERALVPIAEPPQSKANGDAQQQADNADGDQRGAAAHFGRVEPLPGLRLGRNHGRAGVRGNPGWVPTVGLAALLCIIGWGARRLGRGFSR
jgi:hypothetical protein